MDDFTTVASLVAIGVHLTAIFKYASAGDARSVLAAILPMVALFVVLLLAAEADAFADVVIPGIDTPIGALDVASLALVSLAGGSLGSEVLYNWRKAVDNADSAQEPKIGETTFVDHGH
jgi:hypothetical protein